MTPENFDNLKGQDTRTPAPAAAPLLFADGKWWVIAGYRPAKPGDWVLTSHNSLGGSRMVDAGTLFGVSLDTALDIFKPVPLAEAHARLGVVDRRPTEDEARTADPAIEAIRSRHGFHADLTQDGYTPERGAGYSTMIAAHNDRGFLLARLAVPNAD